jgi:hypothetical protein
MFSLKGFCNGNFGFALRRALVHRFRRKGQIMTVATTTKGHWLVASGDDLTARVYADSPSEARRLARSPDSSESWSVSTKFYDDPEKVFKAAKVRLISGFPKIPGHELIFGETVFAGDLLPEATSPAYRVIFDADDLDFYLLDVPSHAVFIPPFRAHATQRGQWKSPTLDECRSRASDAIAALIDFDRSKGYSCE